MLFLMQDRYADLVVHRQLQAALMMEGADIEECKTIISKIPDKRQVDDVSTLLLIFFSLLFVCYFYFWLCLMG